MKKIFIPVVALGLFLSSCGADQATVDKAADEFCAIMKKLESGDLNQVMSVMDDMKKLQEKEEYKSISESQMMDAMGKKCPEGAKKLKEMMGK